MYTVRLVLIAIVAWFASATAFGQQAMEDVVYLKNGSIVRGRILEYKVNETIKIEILGGSILVYPAAEVVEIKKEDSKAPIVNNEPTRRELREQQPLHNPEKGWYHYSVGKTGIGMNAFSNGVMAIGLYHSSGYQFNRLAALGLGLGIERNGAFNMMPVYVDFRGYMMKTSASMFYSLGLGYNAVLPSNGGWAMGTIEKSSGGYYIYPAIGVRFASRKRVHAVLDFGCTIQSAFNVQQRSWDWSGNEVVSTLQLPLMLRPTIRAGILF